MRRRVSLGARVSASFANVFVPFFSCRTVRLFMVAIAPVSHLFPFRTEKLSPDAPMVLPNPRESRSPPFLWIVRSRPPHRPSGPRGTGSFFCSVTAYIIHLSCPFRAPRLMSWLFLRLYNWRQSKLYVFDKTKVNGQFLFRETVWMVESG